MIDTLFGMVDGEAAGWIAALGLQRGPAGGYVRSIVEPRLTRTYVLLTTDAPRLTGLVGDHLCFHHAGGPLRIDDGPAVGSLGPPDWFQVGVAGDSALSLAGWAWALISVIAMPDPSSGEPVTIDRWRPAAGPLDMGPGAALAARLGLAPHVEGGYFRELWAARGREGGWGGGGGARRRSWAYIFACGGGGGGGWPPRGARGPAPRRSTIC